MTRFLRCGSSVFQGAPNKKVAGMRVAQCAHTTAAPPRTEARRDTRDYGDCVRLMSVVNDHCAAIGAAPKP